jgi:hypothetical protein
MTDPMKRVWLGMSASRWALPAAVCGLGLGILVALAADDDNDGMDDAFEGFFGLNTATNDSALDPDTDALDNFSESLLWTDPFWPDTDRDGFADGSDSNPVSRACIPWGDPFFTGTNGEVFYTWPAWLVSAFKSGGDWDTNLPGWHVPAAETNPAGLAIELDRAFLTNDLRFKVGLAGGSGSSLYLDLYDTNGLVVVTNALDNLLSGTGTGTVRIFSIPLEAYSSAVGLWLRRGTGEVTVSENFLYVDLDGDGLDADQEAQLGSSDTATDTDGDGFSDYAEVQAGTDLLDAANHPPTLPAVAHGLGATNITFTTAMLQGMVTTTGCAPTTVFCYWGHVNGGTNAAAWSNSMNLGIKPEGGVSGNVTGLLHDTTYRYRYAATNAAGVGWATSTVVFATAGCPFKMPVSFNGYTRSESLTNFPVMVIFSNNVGGSGFNYGQMASPDGCDLRFTTSDEATNVNYEIERWTTNGVSIVWVQVPLLTNNASIRASWGDPDLASAPATCTTNGATWDSSFKAVWHLGETVTDEATGVTNHFDSTTNRNNGVQYGNDDVTGKIGKGQEFDGSGTADYITFPGITWTPTRFSVSFWIQPDTTLNYNQQVGASAAWGCFMFHTTSAGALYVGTGASDSTGRFSPSQLPSGTMATGVWQQFTFTFDNGAATIYRNGAKLAAKSLSMSSAWTGGFKLSNSLDGMLDECRIDAVARSSNWVWACWMNQASNAMFSSYGTAEHDQQNEMPTIDQTAAAMPSAVTGTSAVLTVLGADRGGEENLVYTWATNGTSPAAVAYVVNGNNAAKTTIVTFSKAGDYSFRVTVQDEEGMTTSSVVGVTVSQALSCLSVSPLSCVVTNMYTQQFSAWGADQFGDAMSADPTWSASGGGVINGSGRFTAISTGGTYTVSANAGGNGTTAYVTVVSTATGPDTDCDGLADEVESGTGVYVDSTDTGTSSTNWDSDLDGIGDGAEVRIWHTDPLNAASHPPTLATIANGSGATNISSDTVTLPGVLTDTGCATTTVFCYWGLLDGGTNAAAWSNSVNLGLRSEGVLSCCVTGLTRSTTYRYRYCATNVAGVSWATSSVIFATADCPYKMPISFSGYTRDEALTNFPVMVIFSNNVDDSGFDYGQLSSPQGYDLWFTNSDETSSLNYEVERWNTNGVSIVWVQVPLLTNNASIWAYWRAPNLTSAPAACTTNGSTWDASFKAVWHLGEAVADEESGGTNHFDSTTNRYNGTQYGNDDVDGRIARAQEFDGVGTADYVMFPGLTWTPTRFSVSFWIKPDTTLNYNQGLGAAAEWSRFYFHTTMTGQLYVGIGAAADETGRFWAGELPSGTMATGVWQQFTFTFDNGVAAFYKGGTRLAAKTLPMPIAWTGGFKLSNSLDGMLDECRIDAVARSSNWVWACWMNQASNGTFSSHGVAQNVEPKHGPSIVTDAVAIPGTVTGTSTVLAVLGGDEWGEETLTYTWTTNGAIPAPVTFDVNGDNAAKTTTVTFAKAGLYGFRTTILNWDGMTTASVVGVTVAQTLSTLNVSPSYCVVTNIFSRQFAVNGADQFGDAMDADPTWSVNGGGMIDGNGRFTAISTGGAYTVSATCGGVCATACVVVVSTDSGPDADLDGLSDDVETGTGVYSGAFDSGTSSTNWDSDLDGIGDGAEVKLWRTDPHSSDTNPPTIWITLPTNNSVRVWLP